MDLKNKSREEKIKMMIDRRRRRLSSCSIASVDSMDIKIIDEVDEFYELEKIKFRETHGHTNIKDIHLRDHNKF